MKITQRHYPTIEIDNQEKDIIQIWMNSNNDSNVIQIERDKYFEFMEAMIKAFDEDLSKRKLKTVPPIITKLSNLINRKS